MEERLMIILPGHSPQLINNRQEDPRAMAYNGITEASLTHQLVDDLLYFIPSPSATILRNAPARREVSWLTSLTLPEQTPLISIHFNAFNGRATGSEVIISSQSNRAVAQQLVDLMANTLSISNRGVRNQSQTATGRIGVLNTKYTNCYLLEICFCDNPTDLQSYFRNRSLLVERLANYLIRLT